MIIKTDRGSIKSDIEDTILTDGTIYGIEIFLGEGRSVDDFTELLREEYEAIMAQERTDMEVT